MRAPQAGGVGVICETEQGHVREVVSDVVRVDARDVRDHEIGWVNAFDGHEPMAGELRLQFAANKEVDPYEQDRCHACR